MDSIEKKVTEISAESQIRKYAKFTEQFSNKLDLLLDGSRVSKTTKPNYNVLKTSMINSSEKLPVFYLVETDSKSLDKTILVFYHICHSITELTNQIMVNIQKIVHEEELDHEYDDLTDIDIQIENFIKSFGFLLDTLHKIQRALDCTKLIFHQLLLSYQKHSNSCFIDAQVIMNKILKILKVILIFDDVIAESKSKMLWHIYKEKVVNFYHIIQNTEYHEYNSGLGVLIEELDQLFSENIFRMFLEDLRVIKNQSGSEEIGYFSIQILQILKTIIKDIQKFKTEMSDFRESGLVVDVTILAIFCHTLFGNLDSNICKQIFSINNKHCSVSIMGNRLWTPEKIFRKHAEALLKSQDNLEMNLQNQRQTVLNNLLVNINKHINQMAFQVVMSVMQMTNCKQKGLIHNVDLLKNENTRILFNYFQLIGTLMNTIASVTNLHLLLKINMTKGCLYNLCKLVELITTMQWVFVQNKKSLVQIIHCTKHVYQYKLLTAINQVKKKISKENYNEQNLDNLCSLQLIEKCLQGPVTKDRVLIASLALNSNVQRLLIPQLSSDTTLENILNSLKFFLVMESELTRLCDSSFLFCHKDILKIYLKCFSDNYTDPRSLMYLLSKLNTTSKLQNRPHIFHDILEKELIHELCGEIETNLRLDFHKKLNPTSANLSNLTWKDCRSIIEMPSFIFQYESLNIQGKIEKYLSNMFYNLITVSLHDWRSYGEIRKHAEHKYRLLTVHDNLPLGTLEQGCDMLHIARNIQEFVLLYCYNINNQVFIEKTSNNKHLNTISIHHVAKSIQTYGTGIINTVVNYTYQFLKKKIYTLSQFLYDEHIKSRLMKDFKHFKGRLENNGEFYSFKYAEQFNKTYKKHMTKSGNDVNYLDALRNLIVEIGNALGFVRMMRSGRVHMGSNAMSCFPISHLCSSIADKINELSNETIAAAEIVDSAVKNVTDNFIECADYLKILVDAFKQYLQNDKNIHMRNFYLIVPALILNFIEHFVALKDNISKKTSSGAIQFTEDGFTMGLSYVLIVLGQISDFNSLHWFDAVRAHYNDEMEKILAQKGNVKEHGDNLQQTLTLSEKRIITFQQEFNLLYYSLCSSKVFFQ